MKKSPRIIELENDLLAEKRKFDKFLQEHSGMPHSWRLAQWWAFLNRIEYRARAIRRLETEQEQVA